ncbi:MAG TPA: chloride channel protein [Bacteroidales bacterium]|jgi:CIC family chloride channel protein|nr:chloride channel protein [Bacteroidales bacterium]NLH33149.1 chloride channel protein [Lentimicrobium sp.]OQC37743.1 MAG: Voltage-gated ClC-type chloride channel ClcB [Bacteroidetes bacterium ADurb.Bin041]MBP7874435.1 chloride channel protein [Bacteroidales bacterium]MCZ2282824.1 chloride channel protein [Bacteroidales bacterium]
MKNHNFFEKILLWRIKHISERNFVLILSVLIGVFSGIAAVLLKNLAHTTYVLVIKGFVFEKKILLNFVIPLTGIFLTVLFVRKLIKDDLGHGVSKVLHAISKKNGYIKPHNTFSSVVASSLTVGFGGSVGLEAPVVLTGSAIGSNLARLFRLNYKTVVLMIGCGSAGAIAGIFKAPIAGVVFTIEMLMIELTISTLIPLLISAVSGSLVAWLLMGSSVPFFYVIDTPFVLKDVFFYIFLGITSGLASFYFSRTVMNIEEKFSRVKNQYIRVIVGSLILGLLIYVFPSFYGEGYESLMDILRRQGESLINKSLFGDLAYNQWVFLVLLLLLIFLKAIATAVTTGAGGVGGTFAPSLFMGGVIGFFTGRLINTFFDIGISESNFSLVGMAGVMAGVMHAPLTAIFLIAEITGGYELFPPLIITATISYLTTKYFEPHSLYNKKLAEKGELITHNKDQAVLMLMKSDNLIETNFLAIKPTATLGDLVKLISKSSRNIFPVVDDDGTFMGIVILDHVREIIFKPELYEITPVNTLMFMPETTIEIGESMNDVAQKFYNSDKFNLVVLDQGKYVGFISRARVFSVYRRLLKDFSYD